jgi:hypothetical protein
MAEAELSLVADSKVEIGGIITDPTLAEFEDVARVYVALAGVTDIGEFGDERQISTIETIDGARVRKKPGTADAGDMEIVVARDPLDPGQIAMRAAMGDSYAYAIRITANDAPAGGTPTVHYLKAYVSSAKNRMGGANDFVQTVFTIAIDAAPLTVEAEAA